MSVLPRAPGPTVDSTSQGELRESVDAEEQAFINLPVPGTWSAAAQTGSAPEFSRHGRSVVRIFVCHIFETILEKGVCGGGALPST